MPWPVDLLAPAGLGPVCRCNGSVEAAPRNGRTHAAQVWLREAGGACPTILDHS